MDLDQSGFGFQRVRTYLGPSLGWADELVQPSVHLTTGGAYNVKPGDSLILVDVAALVTINLPDVVQWWKQTAYQPATGFDRSITIKDLGGNAGGFNITVTPFGTQVIDAVGGSIVVSIPRSTIKLIPLVDLSGWVVSTSSASGGGGGGGDVFKAGNNTFVGINTFSSTITAPTMPGTDNSINVATTAYVKGNLAGYQPLSGDLTSLDGATGTNTLYYRSAPDTWTPVTIGPGLSFSGGVLSLSGPPPAVASTYFFEAGQY